MFGSMGCGIILVAASAPFRVAGAPCPAAASAAGQGSAVVQPFELESVELPAEQRAAPSVVEFPAVEQ